MSRDFFAYLEHYNNETKNWELIKLFRKTKDNVLEPVLLWDGGWSDFAENLTTLELNGTRRLYDSSDLSSELQQEYENQRKEMVELYNNKERKPDWGVVNVADIYIETLLHPIVDSYSENPDDGGKMENPFKSFFNRIQTYLDIADLDFYIASYTELRVVFWGGY